jgi:hypothetical protein
MRSASSHEKYGGVKKSSAAQSTSGRARICPSWLTRSKFITASHLLAAICAEGKPRAKSRSAFAKTSAFWLIHQSGNKKIGVALMQADSRIEQKGFPSLENASKK